MRMRRWGSQNLRLTLYGVASIVDRDRYDVCGAVGCFLYTVIKE